MDNQKGLILILIGILLFFSWLMIKPLLSYVLFAILLAFILRPLHKRMAPKIGESMSGFLMIILVFLVAIVPLLIASLAIIGDARDLSDDLRESNLINTTEVENRIYDYTGQVVDVETTVDTAIGKFTSITFGNFSQILSLAANLAIGITLMLFLLYYLIKDGDDLVEWIKDVAPLEKDIQDNLINRINKTTWAVLKGHVLVALTQAAIAGLGLAVTGVPNFIFWTFVMVILGFIPIIGTIIVWLPAAIYLFLIGQVQASIFLLIYGFVIVGLTDNILRPIVVDRGADLHPGVIIVGVIGGVYIFEAPGLFIGPIMLGVLKSVLVVFRNNYS